MAMLKKKNLKKKSAVESPTYLSNLSLATERKKGICFSTVFHIVICFFKNCTALFDSIFGTTPAYNTI